MFEVEISVGGDEYTANSSRSTFKNLNLNTVFYFFLSWFYQGRRRRHLLRCHSGATIKAAISGFGSIADGFKTPALPPRLTTAAALSKLRL